MSTHSASLSAEARQSRARNSRRLIKGCIAALALFATAMTVVSYAQDKPTVGVNRSNKGDRLIPAAAGRLPRHSSSTRTEPSGKGVPVGCDPAFSPVADPARASIFGRCAA